MIMQRLSRIFAAALLTLALLAGTTRPASAFLDKTRFLAHLGVAYFAFHHWVMKPYQQGAFASGAPHRTIAIVKAGAALLFAVHEARVSQRIAQKSNDPLLKKLDAGVAGLMGTFGAVGARMKAGQFNAGDISSLTSQASSLQTQASANGATIKDVPASVPGT